MKKTLLLVTITLIGLSSFSQTSKPPEYKINGKDTVYLMEFGKFDEPQMYKLYQALKGAKVGLSEATNIAAYDVTHIYYPFIDSLMNVLQAHSDGFRPKPIPKPEPPKIAVPADSTQRK